MSIETELAALVQFYVSFNEEEQRYTTPLDKTKLPFLDKSFIEFMNRQLLVDGPEKANLDKNYKKLTRFFHPDRSSSYSPEIIWIEHQLSEGLNNGFCFKTLATCHEKLTQPLKFKEIEFTGINSKEDCKVWLEKQKAKSSNYSHQRLYDSLISLLDESGEFFDATGVIKPKALKSLVQFIPALIAGYSAALVMEELLVIYTLYFVVLKAGHGLKKSDYRVLSETGQHLQDGTIVSATLSTALLARILELIFWTSRQSLEVSLSIGSSIINPFLLSSVIQEDVDAEAIRNELIQTGEYLKSGMQFDTPELKIIAAPFEKYLTLNVQQVFRVFRSGEEKRKMVDAFLFRLRVLDKLSEPLEAKFDKILAYLTFFKNNKAVYTGKTAEAVDYAEQVIDILRATPIAGLITNEPEVDTIISYTA